MNRTRALVLLAFVACSFTVGLVWAASRRNHAQAAPPRDVPPAPIASKPFVDIPGRTSAAERILSSSQIKLANAANGEVTDVGVIPLDIEGEVFLADRNFHPAVHYNVRVDVRAEGSQDVLARYDFDPFVVERGNRFSDRFQRRMPIAPGRYWVQIELRDLDVVVRDADGNDVSDTNRTISSNGYVAIVK